MQIVPGQRFRKLDVPYLTWEVGAVRRGPDALLYAQLHRIDDRATVKTLSCLALLNRKQYHWLSTPA